MQTERPIPTVEDVDRIKNITDPVIRNLRITQCYSELSVAMARRTGQMANWCTFATWASKQAGQTIRKEDLARLLERRLRQSPNAMLASRSVATAVNTQGQNQLMPQPELALRAGNFTAAVDRASDAVARGNKKVFEEIGREFARFLHGCFDEHALNPQKLADYCEQLRAGDPPEGQAYLRHAFTHYAQALAETDPKTKAELMLLANVEIGFHEQTRLQPEIAESLDAGFLTFSEFARSLFKWIFPANGWFHLAHLYLRRVLGRPTPLDVAIQALLAEVRVQLRYAITELMMTIALPSGIVLRLGEDLAADFPQSLQQIANIELASLLQRYDIPPGSTSGSGALDWADLPDRLHFIIDLFRCYQEHLLLFDPPFTQEQVRALAEGNLPTGKL